MSKARAEQFDNFLKALKNTDIAYVKVVDRDNMNCYINDSKDWVYRIYKKDSTSPTKVLWTGEQFSGHENYVMRDVFETLNISTK